jgi:preprotein translocase subunit YajC
MLFSTLTLFAQAQPAQPQESPGGFLSLPVLMVMIFVLAYFLLIRPAKQQEKQRQALLTALKKNDKVVTSGGIIGVVANIKEKDDEVTLKIDENSNVRLRVTRSSIARVITPEEAAKEQKEQKEQKEGGA